MASRLLHLLAAATYATDPLGPGAGDWSVESPEAHGVSSADMQRMADHIMNATENWKRDCLVVIKDGALIYETYAPSKYNTSGHEGFSMTKTLGALVAGWAQTHGFLDLDADITTYNVKSPRPYNVTSRHIMSQALAGEHGPGEAWEYDAGGTRWINHMIKVTGNAAGQTPSKIWNEQFQGPLGLSDAFKWPADESWAAGSVGTCRDYARIGQLLLNQGRWKGADGGAIVSSDYITEMHTPQTHFEPYANFSNPCYGLLTWLNTVPGSDRGSEEYPGVCKLWPEQSWFPAGSPTNVYLASGLFGQQTMVIPDHNMVLVSMGTTPYGFPLDRIEYEGVCMLFPDDCQANGETIAV